MLAFSRLLNQTGTSRVVRVYPRRLIRLARSFGLLSPVACGCQGTASSQNSGIPGFRDMLRLCAGHLSLSPKAKHRTPNVHLPNPQGTKDVHLHHRYHNSTSRLSSDPSLVLWVFLKTSPPRTTFHCLSVAYQIIMTLSLLFSLLHAISFHSSLLSENSLRPANAR